MKLLRFELYKILGNKIFIICFVAFFIMNCFALVYIQTGSYEGELFRENKGEYNSIIEKCKNSAYPQKTLNTIKEKYMKEENFTGVELTQKVQSQYDYFESYKTFIDEMESRADSQRKFSVFAEKGSFSYNNIGKTPQDFQHLKGIQLTVGNNTCVETATEFEVTNFLMIVLVVVMCILLFSSERDRGLYPLVRCTKGGRAEAVISKLFALIIVTAVLSALFYVANIVVSGLIFGFGDMGRSVQSISLFMECPLKVSVNEYIFLWVISKVITFIALSMIFAMVFVVVKNTAKVYVIIILFTAFQFASVLFIDNRSVFAFFKYINLYYFMSGNSIFGEYVNVNLFSQPVNIINVWIGVMTVTVIASFVITTIVFARSHHIVRSRLRFRLMIKKIRGSVKIFSGESYKHYKTSLVFLAIVFLSVFAYSNLTGDLSIHFVNPSESAYNSYMADLEGEIDSEKEEYLNREQKYFDDLYFERQKIQNDNSLSINEKSSKTGYIDNILETKGKGFERVMEQYTYVKEKSAETKTKPVFINELVCKRLTENTSREWMYFTLLVALVIFSTSNIFACEYKRGMVNLIRCNRFGKARLIATKLLVTVTSTAVFYTLIYLPYMINFVNTFGTKSFEIPLYYMQDFSMLTDCITVFEYILICGIVHFASAVAVTSFVFMLSLLMKNNIMTMIVSSGIFLVPSVAVMNMTNVRMSYIFRINIWQIAVAVIGVIALIVTVFSLITVFMKFCNVRVKKFRLQKG